MSKFGEKLGEEKMFPFFSVRLYVICIGSDWLVIAPISESRPLLCGEIGLVSLLCTYNITSYI